MRQLQVTESELERFSIQPGDLLFARRSLVAEGAGKCSLVREVQKPTVFESSIIRARPAPDRADSRYLFYLFQSPYGRYALGTIRRQVAVAGITGADLAELQIPLPPLRVQREIANALESIDDKIDLNLQMTETLEASARAIFRSWFVDFDPVRAKVEGRQASGTSAETTAVFPGSLTDSPLGPIPDGWTVSPIGDAVRVVGGSTPSTSQPRFWNGSIPFATPRDLAKLDSATLLRTERYITEAGAARISSGVLPAGTVLLSSRAPIGYLALAEVPVAVNQGFIAMICEGALPNHYVIMWARENLDVIKSNAGGTTFAEISKKNFRPIPVLVPSPEVLERFRNLVSPIFHRIRAGLEESRSLTAIRDALLPKLVSGSTRIATAEG
ncbi:MAG: restriction endonuclease subunit S [Actinomycetota bacterium]